MAPPVRDPREHPATWVPGKPGVTRYICPFCDWFVDFDEGEVLIGYFAPVLRFGSRAFDRSQFIEKVLEGHVAMHADEMAGEDKSGT